MKRNIYIKPEDELRLAALGGSGRSENLRRAVALAECAENMAFWLRQAAIDEVAPETEAGIYDALAAYKEAKQ